MADKKAPQTDKEIALYYLRTFADTARAPILILDYTFNVIDANKAFYTFFKVTKQETKGVRIYDLGNGQWDIPELRNVLEDILPEDKELNDYEVAHEFPKVGVKVMLLNARQLDTTEQILLSFEDITLRRSIEVRLAEYADKLEAGIQEKTKELQARVDELSNMNDIMMGRELKMVELKDEIKKLKQEKNK